MWLNFSESDEKEFTIDSIDEDIKDNIECLIRNLGNNINTETFINNNNLMSSMTISASKSKSSNNDDYFIKHEQINEVKINLFFILTKDFRLLEDNYSDFFENQYLKAKLLVSQEIIYMENKFDFKKKEYSFLPIKSKVPEIKFMINNNEIIYKKEKEKKTGSLTFNKENLLNENEFLNRYKNFEVDQKSLELKMKKEKLPDASNEFGGEKDDEKNSKNSEINNITISTKTDKSENEMKGERFYKIINEKYYIRFL